MENLQAYNARFGTKIVTIEANLSPIGDESEAYHAGLVWWDWFH